MNTNSWREIQIDLDLDDLVINSAGVFCKGVIYWHVRLHTLLSVNFDEILHDKLLSFDVSDLKWNTLTVWNESLALFHYPKESESAIFIEV